MLMYVHIRNESMENYKINCISKKENSVKEDAKGFDLIWLKKTRT